MRRSMSYNASRSYFARHALHTPAVNYQISPILGGYRF